MNDNALVVYKANSQSKLKTMMLKSNDFSYWDAHKIIKRTIIVDPNDHMADSQSFTNNTIIHAYLILLLIRKIIPIMRVLLLEDSFNVNNQL